MKGLDITKAAYQVDMCVRIIEVERVGQSKCMRVGLEEWVDIGDKTYPNTSETVNYSLTNFFRFIIACWIMRVW